MFLQADIFSNKFKIDKSDGCYLQYIRKTIETGLQRQQEYIWDNIQNEDKIDSKSWHQILNFSNELVSSSMPDNNNNNNNMTELRQDCIPNGIGFDKGIRKQDIYTMAPLIDKSSNFDVFNEFNNKVYLTKCLLFAHKMNKTFQHGTYFDTNLFVVFFFNLFFEFSLYTHYRYEGYIFTNIRK